MAAAGGGGGVGVSHFGDEMTKSNLSHFEI